MAVAGTLTYKTELDTSGVKKAGSTVKSIIAGLGITKMISKAMNTISSSIDDAVKRYDTLNNFPKVMKNLGISAKDSEKAISKMADKLSGLPTTLDQGAMAVQRFTSKNGDVAKSTDLFLALNNALLAGGASTEIQATALEQLSQAYAKGKPDMMEWRSIQTAMPAQLNQISKEMLGNKDSLENLMKKAQEYADKNPLSSTAQELLEQLKNVKNGTGDMTTAMGTALRTGVISMDEFMQTIVRLNENGTKDFQSFEEQARNSTNGLATAITVAKTQVVKGVTEIITALNQKFENTKFGSLAGFISEVGKKAREELIKISDLIKGEITPEDFLNMGADSIINFMQGINDNLPKLMEKIGDIVKTILNTLKDKGPEIVNQGVALVVNLVDGISKELPTLIPLAVDMILIITEALLDNLDVVVDCAENLVMALTQGITESLPILANHAPVIIEKLIEEIIKNLPKLQTLGPRVILELAKGIIMAIPNLITQTVPNIITGFINGLKTGFSSVFNTGKEMAKKLADGIKIITETIPGIVRNVVLIIINIIVTCANSILKIIQQLPWKIGNIIGDILAKIINFGVSLANWVSTQIPKVINSIIKFFQELPGKIANILKTIISKIVSWGTELASKGKQAGKNLVEAIINAIKRLPSQMVSIGKDIANGLVNGIKSMAGSVTSKVKDFAGGIINGFKKTLKIGSPSKATKEMGIFLLEGLEQGIKQEENNTLKQVSQFSDKILNEFDINKEMDKMYKEMNKTIQMENAKMNFDVYSNNAYNKSLQLPAIIDLSANFEGTIPVQLNLDGEKVWDNQQKISVRKNLQYGGVK